MAEAAAAVAILGAVAAVASTMQQVQAAKTQAKTFEVQAKFAEQVARTEEESAAFEERQARRRGALVLGKQSALTAASGLDLASGSPLLTELDTVKEIELEALNLRRGGAIRAGQARFGGELSKFQARAIRRQIPWIIIGGVAKAGSSGVSGFGGGGTKPASGVGAM